MPEKIECTFEGFWGEVGGSIAHPLHHILRQMSECDDLDEDYRVWHGTDLYVISKENIRKYFETHDKPARPMSEHEELLRLREEVAKLRKDVKRAEKKGDIEVIKSELGKEEEPVIQVEPDREEIEALEVEAAEEERPSPPPRDMSIPPPSAEQRKKDKMSLAQIQSDLAKDLEGKKKTVSDKVIDTAKKKAAVRKRK